MPNTEEFLTRLLAHFIALRLGNCWKINSALIGKIDLMFLITHLQVAKIDWSGLFFIVEVIDFYL